MTLSPMSSAAKAALASCLDAIVETAQGFDYDPQAAEVGDYAADIIRTLARAYLTEGAVCAEGFWRK